MTSLYDAIKQLCKRLKKSPDLEIKLHQAHKAVSRALGYEDWHSLNIATRDGWSDDFTRRVKACGLGDDDQEFMSTVVRFGDALDLDHSVAHGICSEYILPQLERWWFDIALNATYPQPQQIRSLNRCHQEHLYFDRDAHLNRQRESYRYTTDDMSECVSISAQKVALPVVIIKKRRRPLINPDQKVA